MNTESLSAAAVSVTLVPVLSLAKQVVPQLILKPSLLITLPVPVPELVTVKS
jgi:hypothetical protein